MTPNTLNFEQSIVDTKYSLDDISFGEQTESTEVTPVVAETVETANPLVPTPVVETTPVETVAVPPADVTLEDLEFATVEALDEEGNVITTEHPSLESAPAEASTLLEGVRSVLLAKMKRNNIDLSQIDLASMDEEALVNFEEDLDSFILENKYSEVKTRVDPNLGKLWDYIEKGGDPKSWKKLFETQEEVTSIDTSTEDGKFKKIGSYYKEVRGWSQDQISKKLERIKNTNTLDDEFEEVDAEYSTYFEDKQEGMLRDQQAAEEKRRKVEEERKKVFYNKLEEKNLPKSVKEKIFDTAFRKAQIQGTKEITTLLSYRISQMQTDAEMAIKLAQFVADPEAYDTYILQSKQNDKVAENLKKGFETITTTKTALNPKQERSSRVKLQFN